MRSRWFVILIVFSIVLQSFNAVAIAEPEHRLEPQHLTQLHDHAVDQETLFAFDVDGDPQSDHHSIDDCHHCGHCQGSHAQWQSDRLTGPSVSALDNLCQFYYDAQFVAGAIDEVNRPPIT